MPFQVLIENTGETFRCGEGENVLAAMEQACCKGIAVGCRNGGCGACKVRITGGRYCTGKMSRAVVTAQEEADGCALACKTYPLSDLSVYAIGRVWADAANCREAPFSFEFTTTAQVLQPPKET